MSRKKLCGRALVVLAGLALIFSQKIEAANGLGGIYKGRYQCGDWHELTLHVQDLGGGRLAAVFYFYANATRGGGDGAYSMKGEYDERTRRFQLMPHTWVKRVQGYNMVGLEGTFDPPGRTLRGKVQSFNCGAFELAVEGTALAAIPKPAAALPLERRKAIFNMTNAMPESLEYWDAAMDAPSNPRESEPIDDVIDWLKGQNFSCLGTQHVSWNANGTEGIVHDRVDVRERYVIECDGDCTGLHYLPYVQATVFHFAATEPVPVMEFKGTWLGGMNFQWKFTRTPTARTPPDVYVHRWSSAKILSGQNCKAPKTNNHQ